MKMGINIRGQVMNLDKPVIMGILNITPDSFYKASRLKTDKEILGCAENMLAGGARILDIGAYSSRPGAEDIDIQEEISRLSGALNIIRKKFPGAIISVDTFRSEVAEIAIKDFGADIINDISGGELDSKMFDLIAKHQVPYVLMHMKGRPANMHINPGYENIIEELLKWFSARKRALVMKGVKDIIIDPGFGFGKNISHNFLLLNKLDMFSLLDLPVLAGLSRKSMIWKTLEITPDESLTGTTVLNTIAILKGASILRVHDVKDAVQTVKLLERYNAAPA